MKYKIGDRVRCVSGFPRDHNGIVVAFDEQDDTSRSVLVRFDGWNEGHNGNHLYTDGVRNCWYCDISDLEYVIKPIKKIPNFYFALPF